MPNFNYFFKKMTSKGRISLFHRKKNKNNNTENNGDTGGCSTSKSIDPNEMKVNETTKNDNDVKLTEDICGDVDISDGARAKTSKQISIILKKQITKNKYGDSKYGLPLCSSISEKSLFYSKSLQKNPHSSSTNSTSNLITKYPKSTAPPITNLDNNGTAVVGNSSGNGGGVGGAKKKRKQQQSPIKRLQSSKENKSSYFSSSSGVKKVKLKMGTGVDSVASLCKELKSEWSKRNCNLQKCGLYLDQLKIELTKLSYLPTEGKTIPKQDLIIARDVLEIAVEYSVAKKDIPAFERYISQLKCYYYDYRQVIGESDNMYKLLGLNLLYLLSVNRVSEFHTELELLSTEVIQKNRYIRPILSLEQYIMEGRYNKIFQARGSLPTDLYNFFMEILVETVRDEIGACLEKSYEKISIQEAAKRLNLKTKEEVKAFGAKRNWSLSPDGVYYFVAKAAKPKEPLPSLELAEQAIFYARELEMIV